MKRYVIHSAKGYFCTTEESHTRWAQQKHGAWRFLAQERAELVAIELSERCGLPLSVIEVD